MPGQIHYNRRFYSFQLAQKHRTVRKLALHILTYLGVEFGKNLKVSLEVCGEYSLDDEEPEAVELALL